MTEKEAEKAVVELNDLILLPFKNIYESCKSGICTDSKFTYFWSVLQGFDYEGQTFKNISKLATRLFPIPASEAGAPGIGNT